MLAFDGLSSIDGTFIWWVAQMVALLLACALMPVSLVLRGFAFAVVAFSLPGIKEPILGNVTLLLLPLLVAAWRWMDRPIASIAYAVSASVRPGVGIFLLWQLLRRQWRAAAWTVVAGLVLIVLSLPFVGVDGYRDYLAVLSNLRPPGIASENQDLGATVIAFGAADLAGLARILSVVMASAAIIWSLRRDREISFMVTVSASLLMVPLLWVNYLAMLVVPAAFLAQRLHPVLILLPLLTWFPIPSAALVTFVMLLPFVVTDSRSRVPVVVATADVPGAPATV